jgi:hypothetical protein
MSSILTINMLIYGLIAGFCLRELLRAIIVSQNKDVAGLCLPQVIFDSQMLVEFELQGGMWLSASGIG